MRLCASEASGKQRLAERPDTHAEDISSQERCNSLRRYKNRERRKFRIIGNSSGGRPHSRTRSAPRPLRKSGEQKYSPEDRLPIRMAAAFKNAGRVSARPDHRGRRDSPKDRPPSRRTAAFKHAGCASARPRRRGNRDSPRDLLPSRRAAASENAVFPPSRPQNGERRMQKSASHPQNGRGQERGVRVFPSGMSGMQRLAGR